MQKENKKKSKEELLSHLFLRTLHVGLPLDVPKQALHAEAMTTAIQAVGLGQNDVLLTQHALNNSTNGHGLLLRYQDSTAVTLICKLCVEKKNKLSLQLKYTGE